MSDYIYISFEFVVFMENYTELDENPYVCKVHPMCIIYFSSTKLTLMTVFIKKN